MEDTEGIGRPRASLNSDKLLKGLRAKLSLLNCGDGLPQFAEKEAETATRGSEF